MHKLVHLDILLLQKWNTLGCTAICTVEHEKEWQQLRQKHDKSTQERRKRDLANHLSCGQWVKLAGLKNTSMNGKLAEIVLDGTPNNVANSDDRFTVRIFEANSKKRKGSEICYKFIKRINLQALPASETIKVCRLYAKGERGGQAKTVFWPRAVLESTHYSSFELPISRTLGFPLNITRVEPHSYWMLFGDEETRLAPLKNEWVNNMMIHPSSGFRLIQEDGGPAVVWRRDGDVSADDMILLNDFLSNTMTPAHFTSTRWAKEKKKLIEFQTQHGLGFTNDVNI